MTFPDVETQAQSPVNLTRTKRQLADQAIAQASAAQWADAAATNRKLLELGPDAEAENRLAKALWELGELGAAREHYQTALALDPTNRIAERNIDRLKMLLVLILTVLTAIVSSTLHRDAEYWTSTPQRRLLGGTIAAVSLALCVSIVAAGRLIAYV